MKVLILNRHMLSWTVGEDGDYLRPVAPDDRFLITRTFGGGLRGYTPAHFPVVTVLETNNMSRLERVASWQIERYQIERVLALHEKDMLLASGLRDSFGLRGTGIEETMRFRDKALMKDVLASKGYDGVPRYHRYRLGDQVPDLPWRGPTVVKSRWGVGASQVRFCPDVTQIEKAATGLAERGEHDLLVEEFIAGDMFHVDSIVENGAVVFAATCAYVAAPGNYRAGGVAGSIVLTRGTLREELLEHNASVLSALGLTSAVTHVEFFHTPQGRWMFCEAAARPGGGGIDEIVGRSYGVDLIRSAIQLQMGLSPTHATAHALPDADAEIGFGTVGVYHADDVTDTDSSAAVSGVPGVVDYSFTARYMDGPVRHCTDYAHRLIIKARTQEEFDTTTAQAVDRIRSTSSVGVASC